ncbi:hypothetical protein [Paenibacillus macerans]|nr:hypothetical protein [Paenibacillus macerans]MCM3703273.1 hypothetical protein [Paenibacillus macerans]
MSSHEPAFKYWRVPASPAEYPHGMGCHARLSSFGMCQLRQPGVRMA